MSRLLCLSRVCARCTVFSARCQGQQQLVKRFLIQQQSAYVGGSSLPKNRTNSKLWLCGVGVGLALAVGLKSRSDTADSSCEKRETEAARYRRAAEVGRELLERIKAEVGAPGMVVGVSVDGVQVWCEGGVTLPHIYILSFFSIIK